MSTDLKTEKKDQIYKIVLISLGVILLTVSILFLKTYRENRQYIAEIKIEKADLETELRDLSQNYDSLQTSNDTLNQLLVT
jgi:cytochrome c biogenesis factor